MEIDNVWHFGEFPASARKAEDLESIEWMPAEVPNSIFRNLIDAGKIKEDDLYANPEDFGWVSEVAWVFRTRFEMDEDKLRAGRIDIVFEGLDTVALIWLNGKLVKRANNMFRQHEFDATAFLRAGENELMVKLESPAAFTRRQMKKYVEFSEDEFRSPGRVYIRKGQYQFGTDFCPALPGCGIYRPVSLRLIESVCIEDVRVKTIEANEKFADVKIDVSLERVQKTGFRCEISLCCLEQEYCQTLEFGAEDSSASTIVRVNNPFLWYPKDLGEPDLYEVKVQVFDGEEIADEREIEVGIRTVRLLTRDEDGKPAFMFLVNGKPWYVKGVNWVPTSVMAGTGEGVKLRLIEMAANANVNMFRVYGGGVYETEEFYRECDRKGIMVWQDFMFDSGYYPDFPGFEEEVRKEAEAVVRRLRNHPCLAVWCGSANIEFMHTAGQLGHNKRAYFKRIFHELLPGLVDKMCPEIGYIPSTPYARKNKFDFKNILTSNSWDIWSAHQPIREYISNKRPVPKFVAEFGIQSLPSEEVIEKMGGDGKSDLMSLEKHNYHRNGSSRLGRYLYDYFGFVGKENAGVLSQLTQARAIKLYVEYLRANKQHNKGVVYWQYNDSFAAVTWSLVDHCCNEKAGYYYLKRCYNKYLLTVSARTELVDNVNVFRPVKVVFVNDGTNSLTAKLSCKLMDFSGNVLDAYESPITAGGLSFSTPVKLPSSFTKPDDPAKTFVYVTAENSGNIAARNTFVYLPDKFLNLEKPIIRKKLERINQSKFVLSLESDTFVKDAFLLRNDNFIPGDNYFDLVPGVMYKVELMVKKNQEITPEEVIIMSANEILCG